jgi:hypothetical protein
LSRKTYTGALDQLLTPLGFERQDKRSWVRHVGDMEERVDLEKGWVDGAMTASVKCVDMVGLEIMRQAVPGGPGVIYPIDRRIGHFVGPFDKWWKNDPNGPEEIAEIVRVHGLPFLESFRTIEARADHFGRAFVEGQRNPHIPSRAWLAVTLHRMGKGDEACRALEIPKRRTEIPSAGAMVQALRSYLGCPHMDGLAGS